LILLSISPDPDFHPARTFSRSGFDSKSLTNYFICVQPDCQSSAQNRQR